MSDLEKLLRETRPTPAVRAEHREGLAEKLQTSRPEAPPIMALLLPIAALLLLMLSRAEPDVVIPPETRLRQEWTQPTEGIAPMEWTTPPKLEGYTPSISGE